MKKVIINADDFGYSSGVNQGILKAFKKGVLSSTTLMANMPGREEAIQLSKNTPNLGVGGHLVLTCGKPITDAKTIIDEKGEFYRLKEYYKNRSKMKDDEIYSEWCAQIDFLLDNDVDVSHLDSHHHLHTFPENLEITKQIANKYKLSFRNAYNLEDNMVLPYQKGIKGFEDLMNSEAIRTMDSPYIVKRDACIDEIKKVLEKLTENVTELMVHPAFVDEVLYFQSSFNVQRIREVEILTDPPVKKLFKKMDFKIVNYRDL